MASLRSSGSQPEPVPELLPPQPLATPGSINIKKSLLGSSADKSALLVRRADQIKPHAIKWVWLNRIALGKITAIGGDPDVGKSHLVLHMAAVVSVGGEWPCRGGNAPLGSVIILSAEDSPEDTIIPRLLAYGADMSKIHIVEAVRGRERKGRRTFSFQKDLAQLEKLIEEIGDVVLIIVDPISVYLGIGGSSNTAVRRVLEPIKEVAERLQIAVVAITHSAKAKSKKAIHSFIDSIAFAATARGAFLVLRDNEDKSRRLFLKAKMNVADEPEGLAFRIMPAMVGPHNDIPSSLLTFESEFVDKTADEVIAALSASSKTAARDKAKDFLLLSLADHKLVSVTEVQRQAEAAGLKYRTICTAKAELGVQSEKGKGDDSHWYWVLR